MGAYTLATTVEECEASRTLGNWVWLGVNANLSILTRLGNNGGQVAEGTAEVQ